MTNRQPILYLAIALFLVCAYHLSFTWKVRSVEKEANLHAESIIEDEKINAINGVNSFYQSKIDNLDSTQVTQIASINKKLSDSISSIENQYNNFRDTILDALARDYISSMSTGGSDDKIFLGLYTYQECKQREINLGLDLQGGMSVTLEMSVEDVLRNLAKKKSNNFRLALKAMIDAKNEKSILTRDLLEIFNDNYDGNLIDIFYDDENKRKFNKGWSDDEVLNKLNAEVNSAVEATFNVIRNRIDRFGVTQPNIQKLDNLDSPLLICNHEHRFIVRDQLKKIKKPAQ